jgi:hypothetical protein
MNELRHSVVLYVLFVEGFFEDFLSLSQKTWKYLSWAYLTWINHKREVPHGLKKL